MFVYVCDMCMHVCVWCVSVREPVPQHMCGSKGIDLLAKTRSLMSAVWHIPGWLAMVPSPLPVLP